MHRFSFVVVLSQKREKINLKTFTDIYCSDIKGGSTFVIIILENLDGFL